MVIWSMTSEQHDSGLGIHQLTPGYISSGLVQNLVSPTPYVPLSKKDYEILFQLLFHEYFNPLPHDVSPDLVDVAAPRAVYLANSVLKETTLQGVISSNLHHLNQSLDALTKLTKNHSLENVISDPSQLVLTRIQLQGHAIWCNFDANDNPIPFSGKQSG
ncbi:hypothetical protein Tco_1178123 [Tanacetum coccineum]